MAMSPEATKALVLDIVQRVLRSWWTVVAGVCLGLAGASLALDHVPKIYEARCTIFIAPTNVPDGIGNVTSSSDIAIRLNALESAVLSRPYLLDLIQELDRVAPKFEAPKSEADTERTVKALERGVQVYVKRAARTFILSFRHEDPIVAATVVNTLAQRYIDENVNFSDRSAADNVQLLLKLQEATREELRRREEEISRFRREHMLALNDSLQGNLKQLDQKEKEWEANQRAIERAQDQISQLRLQRDQNRLDAVTALSSAPVDNATLRLQQLRAELDALKLRYSDKHPAVEAKQHQLNEFLKTYSASTGGGGEDDAGGEALSPVDAQIRAQEREIARLEGAQATLQAEIGVLNRRVADTPRNELNLSEIARGIDVLRKKYEAQTANLESAKSTQMVIGERRGEQFEIVETANVPRVPVQPKPMMILGLGVIAGLGLFVGPLVIKRLLVPVITSEKALKEFARSPIVFAIPRIPTTEGMRAEYWRRVRNLALSGLSVVALVAAVVFTYDGKLPF